MDVWIQGTKNKVTLTQNDFKAAGGQGSVYIKGTTAYKIYTDVASMLPPAKILELSQLTLPNIIKPQDILLDKNGIPIGYTMATVPDGAALPQLFSKAYRDRAHITPDMMFALVQKMAKGVQHIHNSRILVVDLNEMNFLVNKRYDDIFFIDVDSYQTKSFPATVIMESIRDRHSKTFNEFTDWFSFAVVSIQMLIGVHPYKKGNHPTVKSMDERMQQNISLFNKDVVINNMLYPLTVIPPAYLSWYQAVLERGDRSAPPMDGFAIAIVVPKITRHAGSNRFTIMEILNTQSEILDYLDGVTVATNGVYMNNRKINDITSDLQLTFLGNNPIAVSVENGAIKLEDLLLKTPIPCSINAEKIMHYDRRVYAKNGPMIYELSVVRQLGSVMASAKVVANVMETSTQMFEGVAIQSMLGTFYASIFPRSGAHYQIKLDMLTGYQIIGAKFEKNVLMVVATKGGKYDKFIMRFDSSFQNHDIRLEKDISNYDINFTVLHSGKVLHMNAAEELEVFYTQKDDPSVNVIADPAVRSDCRLVHFGDQAMFAQNGSLYEFSMKKTP